MRVAVVNDLALAREVLRRTVLSVPGYSVAWEATDGDAAVAKAAADRPDVILMDLVMPRMNGVEATRAIMKQAPCPILVVTATVPGHYDLVMRAMGGGALDAVETPKLGAAGAVESAGPLLDRLAKLAATRRPGSGPPLPIPSPRPQVSHQFPPLVLIGSSTGGPEALAAVLAAFPPNLPAAVLIAQHISADFAPGLVTWLSDRCRLPVRAAVAGEPTTAGTVAVAVSNDHLVLDPDWRLRYTPDPREWPYRPSVNALFASGAGWPGGGVGVLLTGMGPDGAEGLLRLRKAGWHTIAQDESTCVVYGMPKAAVEIGAASRVLPIQEIGPAVVAAVRGLTRQVSPGAA
jgi:two-component system response regulator WspF